MKISISLSASSDKLRSIIERIMGQEFSSESRLLRKVGSSHRFVMWVPLKSTTEGRIKISQLSTALGDLIVPRKNSRGAVVFSIGPTTSITVDSLSNKGQPELRVTYIRPI